MTDSGDTQPAPESLTPTQQIEAARLYRHLMALKAQGIKLALAHLEDEIGIHAIGRRANVARLLLTTL